MEEPRPFTSVTVGSIPPEVTRRINMIILKNKSFDVFKEGETSMPRAANPPPQPKKKTKKQPKKKK